MWKTLPICNLLIFFKHRQKHRGRWFYQKHRENIVSLRNMNIAHPYYRDIFKTSSFQRPLMISSLGMRFLTAFPPAQSSQLRQDSSPGRSDPKVRKAERVVESRFWLKVDQVWSGGARWNNCLALDLFLHLQDDNDQLYQALPDRLSLRGELSYFLSLLHQTFNQNLFGWKRFLPMTNKRCCSVL